MHTTCLSTVKKKTTKKKFVYDASSTGYLLVDILAVSPLILSSRVFPTKNKEYLHFPFEEGTLCLDPLITYNMYLTHRAAAGAGWSAPDVVFHANM